MKSVSCEHEFEVSRAARTGFWPGALREHTQSCPVCAATSAVTTALLAESARIGTENHAPAAAQAWLEARRRARLHLRHRALFWFRALRTLTLIYVPAVLVWTLSQHASPAHEAWKPSFRADFSSLVTGPAVTFAVIGGLMAGVCIFMGSWYLLREARTPLHPSPSR
jgi:hypothetical protein